MTCGPEDVRRAAAACVDALDNNLGADWSVRAGEVDMSARAALEHIIEGLTFYARDLATPVLAVSDDEMRLVCHPDSTVAGLVEGMAHVAAVVAAVVAATPDDVRAFHPAGMADRTGFAAMACDEMLVHTGDITDGLGVVFAPPDDICERVLGRLFPWVPGSVEGPAWDRLRWANGRMALPGRPRVGPDWLWHAAPVEEWDGTIPTTSA